MDTTSSELFHSRRPAATGVTERLVTVYQQSERIITVPRLRIRLTTVLFVAIITLMWVLNLPAVLQFAAIILVVIAAMDALNLFSGKGRSQ